MASDKVTNGSGGKTKHEQNKKLVIKNNSKSKYKFGYKAYELINKGYINEKNPW